MLKKTIWFHLYIICLITIIITGGCGNGGGENISINGTATLEWDPPTTNVDGTSLTDLAGYKIYYGTTSGNYTGSTDVGNVTSHTVSDLPSQTYYFTVTAYDEAGNESEPSNEVAKTISP